MAKTTGNLWIKTWELPAGSIIPAYREPLFLPAGSVAQGSPNGQSHLPVQWNQCLCPLETKTSKPVDLYVAGMGNKISKSGLFISYYSEISHFHFCSFVPRPTYPGHGRDSIIYSMPSQSPCCFLSCRMLSPTWGCHRVFSRPFHCFRQPAASG